MVERRWGHHRVGWPSIATSAVVARADIAIARDLDAREGGVVIDGVKGLERLLSIVGVYCECTREHGSHCMASKRRGLRTEVPLARVLWVVDEDRVGLLDQLRSTVAC